MQELGPLSRLLRSSRATICRDGAQFSAADLNTRASVLSTELEPYRGGRIALVSPHVESLVIALAAAEIAGCSILLHRAAEISDSLVERWQVSAVLDSSLSVNKGAEVSRHVPPSVYLPTSGTTGEPKLVQQTMDALLGRIRMQENADGRSRWLLTYHPATFGGLQVLLTALQGDTDLIATSHSSIPGLRDTALIHQVTHISATPTFWRAFVGALGDRAAELKLKQITLGGEIADESVLQMLRTKFPGVPIRHIYASTEAGALFSVRDGRSGFPADWLRTGVDGVQLRIVDNILQVKSPRAMVGYATPAASVMTQDGWLITGDQVEHAGDRVCFRGRQDSILNVGGAKVRPEEVEEALLRISEVADARVYGVPSPLTGFVLAADIVPAAAHTAVDQDDGDLRGIINNRLRQVLEPYKIPRLIRFVESLTLTASGKKQKK